MLVAQSLVGREGLNLHKSCRIVLLLHLEWNPGVVEHNWKVLRERWDNLRAQLHGYVISPEFASVNHEDQPSFDEISNAAPDFITQLTAQTGGLSMPVPKSGWGK